MADYSITNTPALSMDERCEVTDLPRAMCAHCRGHELGDEVSTVVREYEVVATFTARYDGVCVVDMSHSISRGDLIGRLRQAGNPLMPVQGYACEVCARDLPKAT